jgi:DNA-binding response OmpR family regulator
MTAGVLSPRTILIIDDSNAVLAAARSILERAGYRVITRNRPSGSITAILNEKPDVVLLDLDMPTLSGEAILKVLGKSQNRPETIVLMHSALPLETLKAKALNSGAHGYIQKTDNTAELLRRLEYWIRRTKQTSSARVRAAEAIEAEAPAIGWRDSDPGSFRPIGITPTLPSPPNPRVPHAQTTFVNLPSPVPHSVKTLFVDDDWTTLNSYKTTLGSVLDAEYLASGEEAIARLISNAPPDIVICDIVMPFLTGADVYRRALAYDGSWSQRFVFVTGAASQRSVADFLNGVDVKILFKPVLPELLLEAIRKVEAALPLR